MVPLHVNSLIKTYVNTYPEWFGLSLICSHYLCTRATNTLEYLCIYAVSFVPALLLCVTIKGKHLQNIVPVTFAIVISPRTCQRFSLKWTPTLRRFANNKGADQPAHPRSLCSAFVIHFLESTISKLATSKLPIF